MGRKRKFKNPFAGERGRFVLLRWKKGLFLLLFAGVGIAIFFAVKGMIIERKSEITTLNGAQPIEGRSPFRVTEDGTLKSARPLSSVKAARPIAPVKSARPIVTLKVARPIPTLNSIRPIRNLNITRPIGILPHPETGTGSGKSAQPKGQK